MRQTLPLPTTVSTVSTAGSPDRTPVLLTAACGVIGTVALIGSFRINPAPPDGLATAQLVDWAVQHHTTLVLGSWLQGIGSLLTVLFALALVHLAGATRRFAGWATLLAGAAILLVSLVEVTFYLAAAEAAVSGDVTTATVANELTKAVQHVFLIAPAVLLPLSAVLFGSQVLPRAFAYLALALGAILQVLGLVGLFGVSQPLIDALLIVQGVWFLAASLTLLLRPIPVPAAAVRHETAS